MKCISLWQPWASLMALGHKTIETRSRRINYRGPLAIHAANKLIVPDDPEFKEALIEFNINPDELPCGAIVGVCDLVNCFQIQKGDTFYILKAEELFGDWTPGRFAWVTCNMRKLENPIPCRGRQGLFECEVEI